MVCLAVILAQLIQVGVAALRVVLAAVARAGLLARLQILRAAPLPIVDVVVDVEWVFAGVVLADESVVTIGLFGCTRSGGVAELCSMFGYQLIVTFLS